MARVYTERVGGPTLFAGRGRRLARGFGSVPVANGTVAVRGYGMLYVVSIR